jgi:hypothetical protein
MKLYGLLFCATLLALTGGLLVQPAKAQVSTSPSDDIVLRGMAPSASGSYQTPPVQAKEHSFPYCPPDDQIVQTAPISAPFYDHGYAFWCNNHWWYFRDNNWYEY